MSRRAFTIPLFKKKEMDPNTAYLLETRMSYLPEICREYIPKGKVLEVGCNWGWFTLELALMGHEVTGLNYYKVKQNKLYFKFIQRVAERNDLSVELVEGDCESLPWEDETFDTVACISTLEHVNDPLQGAFELRRVVKPGGRLLIAMPNWVSIWMSIAKYEGWIGNMITPELRAHTAYNYFSIRKMFIPYGFEQVAAKPILHFTPCPSFLRYLQPLPNFYRLIQRIEKATYRSFPFYLFGQLIVFVFQKNIEKL